MLEGWIYIFAPPEPKQLFACIHLHCWVLFRNTQKEKSDSEQFTRPSLKCIPLPCVTSKIKLCSAALLGEAFFFFSSEMHLESTSDCGLRRSVLGVNTEQALDLKGKHLKSSPIQCLGSVKGKTVLGSWSVIKTIEGMCVSCRHPCGGAVSSHRQRRLCSITACTSQA